MQALQKLKEDGTLDQIMKNFIGKEDEKGKYPYKKKNVKRTGTLTVATNAEFPPYEYFENGKICGLDADMMQAVCDEIGMNLKIQNMDFDSIITAVKSGKADVGAAGMTVTEDRLKNIDFSDTYAHAKQVVISKRIQQRYLRQDRLRKHSTITLSKNTAISTLSKVLATRS